MYKCFFKRLFDIFFSVILLVVLSPVLLITAIAIKLDSKGAAVFKQKRLGRYGKEFEMLKFRSMCENAENMGNKQYCPVGDARVTRVGRIIRATSIDELLQLVNILKGEMSFIGFRPPLTYHPWPIEEYTDEQKKMFELRPGITGWAQVNGRKAVMWEDRIKMGVWYAENATLWLDVKILFMTVFKVFANADNDSVGKTVNDAKPEGNNKQNIYGAEQ